MKSFEAPFRDFHGRLVISLLASVRLTGVTPGICELTQVRQWTTLHILPTTSRVYRRLNAPAG